MYDPEAFGTLAEVSPVRTFPLTSNDALHPFKEIYFTYGEFYSDGTVIVCYIPPSTYVKYVISERCTRLKIQLNF